MIELDQIVSKLSLTYPSPIEEVSFKVWSEHNVVVDSKREDLIHPIISGNKWRKLKYNILDYYSEKAAGIITYGGVHSNHIYACAEVCCKLEIPMVSILRGECPPQSTPSIDLALKAGIVHYVSRSEYRIKDDSSSVKQIIEKYPNCKIIPEGGSSIAALKGLDEMCCEIPTDTYDYIIVAAGTGATAASIIRHCKYRSIAKNIIVVSALKGGFMRKEVTSRTPNLNIDKVIFADDYHFGGYAKTTDQLITFNNRFTVNTNHPTDLVYNAKCVFALHDFIIKGTIPSGSKVLWINTGGRR